MPGYIDQCRAIPKDEWIEAIQAGMSLREMSRQTGINRKVIRKHLEEIGVLPGGSVAARWKASGLKREQVAELLKTEEGRRGLQSVTGYSWRQILRLSKQFREQEAEMDIPEVARFVKLARTAQSIADSAADWETKYDLIFSDHIIEPIKETGIGFDWCDPDTTYEEDVTAFVTAVSAKADELQKVLDSLED